MAAESAGRDVAVEAEDGRLPVGLGPALCQVGLEWVESAGELALAALDHVLPTGGAGVSLDGVASPAQVAGGVADLHALVEEFVDEGMMGAGPFGEPSGRIRLFVVLVEGRFGRCLPNGLRFWAGRRQVAQTGAVGREVFSTAVARFCQR
ncbi:hypothetical protein ABT187_45980 [Streptomyces sp. NPDC001817]|uniref:hypothetical protein n=1 Tax=Streptomyces sp. NPDC001817 TaxID=3154398 RepID=UPI00331EB623